MTSQAEAAAAQRTVDGWFYSIYQAELQYDLLKLDMRARKAMEAHDRAVVQIDKTKAKLTKLYDKVNAQQRLKDELAEEIARKQETLQSVRNDLLAVARHSEDKPASE